MFCCSKNDKNITKNWNKFQKSLIIEKTKFKIR